MRRLAVLVACSWVLACQEPSPTLAPEPREPPFKGCDYDPTPLLTITPDDVWLDGVPVDLAAFEATLRAKQSLHRELAGGLKTEIVVQVRPGVSETRVAPFLATARDAGFVDAVRL